jgi:hypothetical protein
MLSPDRSEPRAGDLRRSKRRLSGRAFGATAASPAGAAWEPAEPFDPNEPWDIGSAEALTRLYESEEGNLSRPAPRQPARHAPASATGTAAEAETAQQPVDRTWLEAHLGHLARRLQDLLIQPDVRPSLAALGRRLDAFEDRFSAALGRVAQRSDLDGLKSIETSVMELVAHLDRARDRLELIGDVDEQVRGLARKLDEAGEQRAGALERLLRDGMAEWRESEQRTASALHSLEEAVSRLGDTVDAMEASKPAPDLAVPPFAPHGPERPNVATDTLARLHMVNGRPHTTPFYHAMLDAADYAPRPEELISPAAPGPVGYAGPSKLPAAAVEWSAPAAQADLGRSEPLPSMPARWHVMAMREKLRQTPAGFGTSSRGLPALDAEMPPPDTFKRASLNLLLTAGAAMLAGTTYVLSRTVAASLPGGRAMSEPTPGGQDLADPAGQRLHREGAG